MEEQAAAPPYPAVVGARALLGGRHLATVRYVGALEGQPGTWVGLEYDEPGRGKHDGCHAGRRYFGCSPGAGPAAASFVRLPKFLEAADGGRSLLEAARERYTHLSAADGGSGLGSAPPAEGGSGEGPAAEQLFVSTAGNRRVAVEVAAPAAAARRASAAGAALAVLAGERVSSVGPADQLRAVLPSLTELDLSDNLVASWRFVAELAAALPSLRTLNLSGNRLALPSLAAPAAANHALASDAAAAAALAGLQTLVLNGCGVAWEQAVAVGCHLPALRELRLCGNRLASLALPADAVACAAGRGSSSSSSSSNSSSAVSAAAFSLAGLSLDAPSSSNPGPAAQAAPAPPAAAAAAAAAQLSPAEQLLAAAFPQLELLDLDGNELASWAEVAALRGLPALRVLGLSGNRLADVRYPGGFASLSALLLGANRLAGWAAVDQLDLFPALEDARLSDNPLTLKAPGAARYQCIARVSRVVMLNASAISAAERWDAELNYLRLVTDELAAATSAAATSAAAGAGGGGAAADAARAAVLAANPRFAALTQKYGELTPAAPKAAAGSALGSSMAAVTVCHNGKALQKKLPVSLTVGRLKLMLERLLRVKAAQQALLLVPPADSEAQPEDITDEEQRELRFFDVADGYRLEVSAADPAARAAALAAAKAEAAAAHAARMEQHERAILQFRAVEQRLMA